MYDDAYLKTRLCTMTLTEFIDHYNRVLSRPVITLTELKCDEDNRKSKENIFLIRQWTTLFKWGGTANFRKS